MFIDHLLIATPLTHTADSWEGYTKRQFDVIFDNIKTDKTAGLFIIIKQRSFFKIYEL